MKKSRSSILVLTASLLLSACTHPAATCDPSSQSEHSVSLGKLKALKLNNATEDATNAFAKGDTRLLGVYGFALEVPGYLGDPYSHKSSIRILDGTGDAFCTKEEQDLNHNARAYAKKYNQTMLYKLKQAGISLDPVSDARQ